MKVIFSLLIIIFSLPSIGQVEYGGKPLRNDHDFDPSRVLYLLEQEDEMYIESLKVARNQSYSKALNYAVERPADISPDFNGEWVESEGKHIWRAHLISPGAHSLGLVFSEFELIVGARLFIYSPDGKHIKGGFTSNNNKAFGGLYISHIPGDEVIVELQVSNPSRDFGRLRIGTVSHAFLPVFASKGLVKTGLGTSQDCEVDVNCDEGDEWQQVKRAVCHIESPTMLCTGVLVNNVRYDAKPYILTAEHCINKSYYAERSVFTFGYENSDCGVQDATLDNSISGSQLLATGRSKYYEYTGTGDELDSTLVRDSLDFSLLKLYTRPPRSYNVYYAGWDIRDMDHDAPVALHHPNADAMKISLESSPAIKAEYLTGDLYDYLVESNLHIRQWDIGTTEGGSSGSPLFNSQKKVIGLLSGGVARCGDSIGYDKNEDRTIYALKENIDDFFSQLAFDWSYYAEPNKQLKKWLDPNNSGQLVIGGLSGMSVGIAEKEYAKGKLYISPNPAVNVVQIRIPDYQGEEVDVRAYDIAGRIHALKVGVQYPFHLDVSELNPGLYILQLKQGDRSYRGNLIVTR